MGTHLWTSEVAGGVRRLLCQNIVLPKDCAFRKLQEIAFVRILLSS